VEERRDRPAEHEVFHVTAHGSRELTAAGRRRMLLELADG
jgi:hypothetical protein